LPIHDISRAGSGNGSHLRALSTQPIINRRKSTQFRILSYIETIRRDFPLPPGQPNRFVSHPFSHQQKEGSSLQVLVRDNNVDQALRVLKKKLQREGIFREMKARRAYEKPSERRGREKAEAVRQTRKAARKLAIREGLIAGPVKKPRMPARPARPAAPAAS
jgi:small subunit ribosomal protein S21